MLAARVGGCVSLGQGVPSFRTPTHVVDAVSRALRQDPESGKYSLQPGIAELRSALAHYLEREKGIVADPETEIAITVGAMEGLLAAVLTLVEKGDEVILKVRANTIDEFDKLMEDLTRILAPRLSLLKDEISKRMEVENAPAKT